MPMQADDVVVWTDHGVIACRGREAGHPVVQSNLLGGADPDVNGHLRGVEALVLGCYAEGMDITTPAFVAAVNRACAEASR